MKKDELESKTFSLHLKLQVMVTGWMLLSYYVVLPNLKLQQTYLVWYVSNTLLWMA